jgi:stress response protein YsnF
MPTDLPPTSSVDVELHQERAEFDVERIASRAVVRRRVVEQVETLEVTVRREVLEIEHAPVDGAGAPAPGAPRSPLVVVLSEEVPVVHLEVRPYEQVTLDVRTVTSEQEVSATVGTEHAEVLSDAPVVAP